MASKTRSEIFAEQLANVTASLQSKYDLALKEADDTIPAKMEVKQLSFNVNNNYDSFRDKSSYSYLRDVVVKDPQIFGNSYEYTIPKTKEAAKSRYEGVLKELDEKFKKVETVHQDNLIAIQNNKLIHEKVQVFMQKVGIPQHYTTYEFKTSRSSKRTSVGHIAGWAEDLRREVRTSDGYEGCVNNLKKSKEDLEAFYEYFYTPLTLQNSFCVVDYFEDNFVVGTNRNKCILFSKEDCELVIESLKHKGYKFLPIKVRVTAEKKLYRTLGTGLHLIKDDEGEFQCIKIIAKDHSVTYFNYTWGCIMQDTQKTFFDKYQVYQVSDISPKYNQKQF